MESGSVKRSYIKEALGEQISQGKTPEDAKQETRKMLLDMFSALPQEMFSVLYTIVCPKKVKEQEFLAGIFGNSMKEISMDSYDMYNIQKSLPPINSVLKNTALLYKEIISEIKPLDHVLSKNTIQIIRERLKDFLSKRNAGIRLFYKYKDNPELLLKRLLHPYVSSIEKGKSDEILKGYIENKNMGLYIDSLYGTIYLLIAPNFIKKCNIRSEGSFKVQCFMEKETGDEEDFLCDFVEAYVIFGTGKIDRIGDVLSHEKQHLIHRVIGNYVGDDFFELGKNEIMAFIKHHDDIEKIKKFLLKSPSYQYLPTAIQQKENHIKIIEKRLGRLREIQPPKVIIDHEEEILRKAQKELEDYPKLWEEYIAHIGEYVDIADAFKKAKIPNYLNLLSITPIRKWKKLLKTYSIS